jgi:hypothetical protein
MMTMGEGEVHTLVARVNIVTYVTKFTIGSACYSLTGPGEGVSWQNHSSFVVVSISCEYKPQ